MHVKL